MQSGRVGKPYFSVHWFRLNSFRFSFSHFLDLSFCFGNPKMSVPPFVPHHCFPCWHSFWCAALECAVGGKFWDRSQGALTCAVVSGEQQSITQWLLSKHLALWAPISGLSIALTKLVLMPSLPEVCLAVLLQKPQFPGCHRSLQGGASWKTVYIAIYSQAHYRSFKKFFSSPMIISVMLRHLFFCSCVVFKCPSFQVQRCCLSQ